MNRKVRSIAVVLGIWCAALLVACYEDNITPPDGQSSRTLSSLAVLTPPRKRLPQPPTVPPRKLRLRQGNAFACGIVEYTGKTTGQRHMSDEMVLPLAGRPTFQRTGANDTTGLGRVHFIQWEAGTSNRMFEASCVVPRTEEASQFAKQELKKLARARGLRYQRTVAHAGTTASSVPSVAGGDEPTAAASGESAPRAESGPYVDEFEVITEEGHIDETWLAASAVNAAEGDDPNCWYNPGTGNLECSGEVSCWTVSPGVFECNNACTAYFDSDWDYLEWNCPAPYPEDECDPITDDCCVPGEGGIYVFDYDQCDECYPGDECCTQVDGRWVIDDECDECSPSDLCCIQVGGEWVWDTGDCPQGGGGSQCVPPYQWNSGTQECEDPECPFGYYWSPVSQECELGHAPCPDGTEWNGETCVEIPELPHFTLKCNNAETSVSVGFGENIECVTTANGEITDLNWRFEGGGVELTGALGSDNPLFGVMLISGTLEASGTIDSSDPVYASIAITVTQDTRNWTWFNSGWDGATNFHFVGDGSGPKDGCLSMAAAFSPTTAYGQAFGAKCTSMPFSHNPTDPTPADRGWSLAQLTSGPNSTLWYATSFNHIPFMLAQFHKAHRTDGPSFPLLPTTVVPDSIGQKCAALGTPPSANYLNFRQANSITCLQKYVPSYDSLRTFLEGHELCHVLLSRHSLSQDKPKYDVPKHVQYFWAQSEGNLQQAIFTTSLAQLFGVDTLSPQLDLDSGADREWKFAAVYESQSLSWVVHPAEFNQYRRLPTLTSVCP